ncbi:MAG: energy-coupling factor ABC transporter ATP-binding protein [Steroidobacteraceae bacterium]|nr:energy-coupling factor ABC transporter ATP-binding protein [Steroidobacteraceae bacterium]
MSLLAVNQLSYHYPDGHEALRGLSFMLAPGERVALIGPNGAGKSTLLLHLNGLLPDRAPATPRVTVDGLPLVEANLAEVRRRVGLLFQDPDDQLFCPTVWEDVAFGPQQLGVQEPQLSQLVRDSLAQVGLAGFEERLPHHLSRGEKRRVCLAGLLACEARLLVLDEPTSDLDPRGRRELMGLLTRLPMGQLIATHDLEFVVEICPRAIVLDGGRIVADGPTLELLDDEALMLAHGLERPHILRHRHPH